MIVMLHPLIVDLMEFNASSHLTQPVVAVGPTAAQRTSAQSQQETTWTAGSLDMATTQKKTTLIKATVASHEELC